MKNLQIHEIESVVLGSLLFGAPFEEINRHVDTDDFQSDKHKVIFKAIKQQVNEGKPVDTITLHEQGINIDSISNFNKYSASTSNAEHYAKQLADYSATQKIKKIINNSSSSITSNNHLETTSELIRQLDAVLSHQMNESYSWEQVIAIGMSEIDQVIESNSQPIYSNLESLDERLRALHGSRLIIIAARPGTGKTALAQQIALASTRKNKSVGIISLEMSVAEIAQRAMANYFHVNGTSLARGNIELRSQIVNNSEYKQFIEHPIFVDDNSYRLEQIVARISQWKRKHNIDFAIIDYIGLIDINHNGTRNEALGIISRTLKQLCKRLNMPILVLCQLNRSIEKEKREPRLSDLRESGHIEQDADMVMILTEQPHDIKQVTAEDHTRILPYIVKNRVGPKGNLLFWSFKGRTQQFIENSSLENN